MADKPLKQLVSTNFMLNQIQNAVVHPLASDPAAPVDFQIWGNTTTNKIKIKINGVVEELATLGDVNAGGLSTATFDANTILKADADDTPVALPVAPSSILGRAAAGGIAALTPAEVKTVLGIPAGALADQGYVDNQIATLIDTSPDALNTLNELAAALGDDANFSATVNFALGNRTQQFTTLIGDATATTFALTHGFTRNVTAALYKESGGERYWAGESAGPAASVTYTFDFAAPPANNEYRVVIQGLA